MNSFEISRLSKKIRLKNNREKERSQWERLVESISHTRSKTSN